MILEATTAPYNSNVSKKILCSEKAVLGYALVDALPRNAATFEAAVQDAANGNLVRFEATHTAQDGSLCYIDFSIKPVELMGGRIDVISEKDKGSLFFFELRKRVAFGGS
jgi:hypothetical protein